LVHAAGWGAGCLAGAFHDHAHGGPELRTDMRAIMGVTARADPGSLPDNSGHTNRGHTVRWVGVLGGLGVAEQAAQVFFHVFAGDEKQLVAGLQRVVVVRDEHVPLAQDRNQGRF
jgi:hypothetical protein